jgi:hypothetical protein
MLRTVGWAYSTAARNRAANVPPTSTHCRVYIQVIPRVKASPGSAYFTSGGGSKLHTFQQFLVLGIEHIATGYDHLSFLLGLLIATSSLRSLVKVVTSFTVAHSITLALATFDIV